MVESQLKNNNISKIKIKDQNNGKKLVLDMINVFDEEEVKARKIREQRKKKEDEIMIKNLKDNRIKNKPSGKKN